MRRRGRRSWVWYRKRSTYVAAATCPENARDIHTIFLL
eukprot:COSAG02_NODE_53638_length_300_cov_1.039801_1_plen_37_part_10